SRVGLDGERGVAAEACAIDLYVLHHALHIVAGFHERDALDPVYGIDLWVARIAKPLDPLPHPPTPGIVGRKRQDVVAAIVLHHAAKLSCAHLKVIGRVVLEVLDLVGTAERLAGIPWGGRRN